MPDNKMLDGIKKISGQDLNKARETVLKSIGETRKHAHEPSRAQEPHAKAGGFNFEKSKKYGAVKFKKVDGIFVGARKNSKELIQKQDEQKNLLSPLQENKTPSESIKIEDDKPAKQSGHRKETLEIKSEYAPKEKKQAKKIEKKSGKPKKKSKKAKLNFLQRWILNASKGKKKKSAKKPKISNAKPSFKISQAISIRKVLRFFIYVLLVSAMAFILFYILFFTALTIFNYDSRAARTISKHLPAPVLITKIGIVEYYEYKDAKDNFYYYNKNISEEKIKQELIKEVSINNFAEKYGIQISNKEVEQEFSRIISGKSEDEIKKIMGAYYELGVQRYMERVVKPRMASEKANQAILYNQKINYSALSRIAKIRQAAEAGKDFYTVAEEMGDGFGFGKYYDFDEAVSMFGDSVKSIGVGQTSDVIIINNRYYAIHCFARRENSIGLNSAASPESPERDSGEQASGPLQPSAERLQRGEIGLRHVFVNAKSLDDYVSETVSGLKVWSFVD